MLNYQLRIKITNHYEEKLKTNEVLIKIMKKFKKMEESLTIMKN